MRSDALRRISAVSGRGAPGAVTTVQVSPQHGSDQLGVCVVSLSIHNANSMHQKSSVIKHHQVSSSVPSLSPNQH